MVKNLLRQQRIPTCTVISVVTTLAVETLVILFSGPSPGYAAIGAIFITYFSVFAGLIVNIIAGWAAYRRRELWGGRIAFLGVVIWIATLVALPIKIG